MARGLCIYCKIPVLKDDYTSIPAHVTCVSRTPSNSKRGGYHRTKGIDYSGSGAEYKNTFDFTGFLNGKSRSPAD